MSDGPLFDLAEGRRRRDEAIARVELSGGDAGELWAEAAHAWLERRAALPGEFNADDLRAELGPPPGHYNRMGAVFRWAILRDLIERVGYRPRKAANAHAQAIAVYRGKRAT